MIEPIKQKCPTCDRDVSSLSLAVLDAVRKVDTAIESLEYIKRWVASSRGASTLSDTTIARAEMSVKDAMRAVGTYNTLVLEQLYNKPAQ